jgi:hypothetical protein
MRFPRAAGISILGCLCALPAGAQGDACKQRTIPVSIGTTDGSPIPALDSTNLEGMYRNKPIRVISTPINQEPPRAILLFDTSGSMRDVRSMTKWNLIGNIAENLLSEMPPASEIGLGFFSNKLEPVALPTTDRKILRYQLEGLHSHPNYFGGRTALWSAIVDSLKMLDRPHVGDIIYVITDGENNSSKVRMNRVSQALAESGVRLFTFLCEGLTMERFTNSSDVSRVSKDTGGGVVALSTYFKGPFAGIPDHDLALVDKSGKPTWLGSQLRSQYRQMLSFYRVDIELPETVDKPREWYLDLAGFDKPQRGKLVLTYPRMLAPCH